jgi:acetolactate synthase-1/3 small subunit
LVENKFGVLARIAGMFSGRGFNIETSMLDPWSMIVFPHYRNIIGDGDASISIKQVYNS